jgi:hypothetical protein
MFKKVGFTILVLALTATSTGIAAAQSQTDGTIRVAAVRYGGGGDWYQAQTPLPFLLRFIRENTLMDVALEPDVVELGQQQLFRYPFIFISGHGNIVLTEFEAERLRAYVERGGFLYIDDDYGLDPYIRRELQKVFPGEELVELPFDHPIYHQHFSFPDGLPKIHEHDGHPPQGFGIFVDGRLGVYYTYETNVSDGWEPPEVHANPPELRRLAFQMGTNILMYALTN